jgi:CRISPR/Cas system-associated exonuclease Cas4 (RecB family)
MKAKGRDPVPTVEGMADAVSLARAGLPPDEYEQFIAEYNRQRKSQRTAYILWGLLGFHYAYLGKWIHQVLYWATAGGFGIWALSDLFRLPGMVRDRNEEIAAEIMRWRLRPAATTEAGPPPGASSPAKGEITLSEIRDYFSCPYVWWFRNVLLSLEDQERLQRVRQEPGLARTRIVSFEVPRTPAFGLFSMASLAAGLIFWILSVVFRRTGPLGPLLNALSLAGTAFLAIGLIGIIRWSRWRQRTPAFDRALAGKVLFLEANERERRLVRAAQYGIAGPLNCVFRHKGKLATMEYRPLETPKSLCIQDRMQAVAQALLAEAEFGERPEYAYVVYPDKTFGVRMIPDEVQPLLHVIRIMRTAGETATMPEAPPAWNLCPACPIPACPKRVVADKGDINSCSSS